MVHQILEAIGLWVQSVEAALGYPGVALLMGIESACIPLPSEVIMPFAGSLVALGKMSLVGITFAGAIGCVLGSIPAYYLGAYGGRPVIEKYGKYVLLSKHDLDMADALFAKHGEWVILGARMLPVIRTFIAFPAGVVRMNMPKFILYTFAGSLPWCFALGYLGQKLGENWDTLRPYFHKFDALIGAVIVLGAAFWIWRHLRAARTPGASTPA